MQRYSAYKDSGISWVGEIPAHWQVLKGKWLFKKMQRPVRDEDDVVTAFRDGTVTLRSNRRTEGFTNSLKEIGYQGIRKGDLIIHQMDAFAGAIGVSDSDGKSTPVYSVCLPIDDADPTYYAHLLRRMAQSQWILALAKGIRERSSDFRFNEFANQEYPVPPAKEQKEIVAFLEEQTAVINQFLTNKRRLIALLEEQKQVVINTAVTQGLDTAVARKPSGIDWLGDIPAHWEIKKLKYIAEVQTGLTLGQKYPNISLIERPYLRVANVQDGYLDLSEITTIQLPVDKAARYELQVGDVLMTEGGDFDKLGRGYVWEGQIDNCLHQNHIFAVRPNKEILRPYFLTAIMSSLHGKEYFIEASKQTTNLASINSSKLKRFPVLLPPLKEQQHILDHLEQKTAEINAAIDRTQREIELIEEYRTTLIAHAVTGKIDVRSGV